MITVAIVLLQNIPTHIAFVSLLSQAVRRLEHRLRAAIVLQLQQLSIAFHDRAQAGRLQAKMLRDVDAVSAMCTTVVNTALAAGFTLVFAMASTLADAPLVALFFLGAIPLALSFGGLYRRPLRHHQHEFRAGVEALSARVGDMIEMIPVTRAHGVEDHEVDAVGGHLDAVLQTGRRLDAVTAAFQAMLWVSFTIVNLGATAFAAYLAWRGRISIGDVVKYSAFYQLLLGSVQSVLAIIPAATQGVESLRSIGEVLDSPDLERNLGKTRVPRVDGRLTFEDVTFAYAGATEPAVSDFSLSAAPGDCIAIVGESGSGKIDADAAGDRLHQTRAGSHAPGRR